MNDDQKADLDATLQSGWYLNALSVAMRRYVGQFGATGRPRFTHNQNVSARVAAMFRGQIERRVVEAAVLYDVILAGMDPDELRQLGISEPAIDLIRACTPPPGAMRWDGFLPGLDRYAACILLAAAAEHTRAMLASATVPPPQPERTP